METIKVDYVVIYGCHIRKVLNKRLDYFFKVKNNYEFDKIVLTGGIGLLGNFNESEYMKNYLVDKGINEKDMILEDKSRTTKENNANIIKLLKLDKIDKKTKILLISNKIHISRIKKHLNSILNNKNIEFYYDIVQNVK